MNLCGLEISGGEKRDVKLQVPGGGFLDATLFCGSGKGKTLVMTAGVHGCEYNGIRALQLLSRELEPEKLAGQVILVPLINQSGFYRGEKQVVPEDGINLNRAFPGNSTGTASARIAAAIEDLLYPYADLLVDLHGGDVNEMAMNFAYFPAQAEPEVCEQSRRAAQALSMPYRVASSAKNGLYSWASRKGIPALLLERGGGGRWSAEEVQEYCRNVYELLDHLKILPQTFPKVVQQEITESVYIEAEEQGFWYPRAEEGKKFSKGTILGELRDTKDDLLKVYYADFDGVTLYYTMALGVKAGDPLIAYGKV